MSALPDCAILVGGWPCQDLSQAGRMAGMGGGQSGLISHVFRLLDARRTKPNVVLLENVAFARSEEHTSELQSLMRISYAVFCLKKKNQNTHPSEHVKSNKMHTNN